MNLEIEIVLTENSIETHPQDTIAAIRALKEFGESINNRQLFNLLVDLEVTSDGNWKKSMHIQNGSLTDYMTAKVMFLN